jgi:TRAP-type mannitol/chloroaromatic compound transport system permease small subunit
MPRALIGYVRFVDAVNRRVGRFAMYLLFVLMGILLWSAATKIGSDLGAPVNPSLWTLEMAQFVMVAYYVLGGPYSMQLGAHVRMDLLYGDWTPQRKAWVDAFTIVLVVVFLAILIWGAFDSTVYSLQYGERNPTAWRPYLWPIKVVMVTGFVLMLLQAVAEFLRDLATIRGVEV